MSPNACLPVSITYILLPSRGPGKLSTIQHAAAQKMPWVPVQEHAGFMGSKDKIQAVPEGRVVHDFESALSMLPWPLQWPLPC